MRLRYLVVPLAGVAVVLSGMLVFGGLNTNLTYYLTPSEANAQRAEFPDGRRFRLAGVVVAGSVQQSATQAVFEVGGDDAVVTVTYDGVPPQLFGDGIQVVVEGAWQDDRFVSDTMLVKHDEEYAPPGDTPLADLSSTS